MRTRAFTLIELMISVAIIAILAAIAIPSLLRSRMAANEVAAIAALRTIATAQNMFIRTNYDYSGYKLGVKQYAPRYVYLYDYKLPTSTSISQIALIDKKLAQAYSSASAYGLGATQPYMGYIFRHLRANENGTLDAAIHWGATATPQAYNFSGVNTFVIWDNGVVYQYDYGTAPVLNSTMHSDPTQWGFTPSE